MLHTAAWQEQIPASILNCSGQCIEEKKSKEAFCYSAVIINGSPSLSKVNKKKCFSQFTWLTAPHVSLHFTKATVLLIKTGTVGRRATLL